MSDNDPTWDLGFNGNKFWGNCKKKLKISKKNYLYNKNLVKISLWLDANKHLKLHARVACWELELKSLVMVVVLP
jgi:hypothetical protein